MSVFAQAIINSKYAENVTTTEYTSSNITTIIDKFTVTNISGSAATLTVHIVPDQQFTSNANMIIKTLSVAASATTDIAGLKGHVLAPGDYIRVLASAADSLVIRASGRRAV